MKEKKDFLRARLIAFQREIDTLKRAEREQQHLHREKDDAFCMGLFEVLDAFERMEENLAEREGSLDKSSRMLAKNVRSIHRKLSRVLKANHRIPVEFPDGRARMDTCKVVGVEEAPDKPNETVLSVLKKGYVDTESNRILRKAEVITVRNPEQ